MKLHSFSLLLFIIVLSSERKVSAQNTNVAHIPIVFSIPAIALVDFAGSDRRITFIAGKGAEQIISPSTLDKTWINYSSIVDFKISNLYLNFSNWSFEQGVVSYYIRKGSFYNEQISVYFHFEYLVVFR